MNQTKTSLVREYLSYHPELGATELARKIIKEQKLTNTPQEVDKWRQAITKVKREDVKLIEIRAQKEQKYEVVDNHYVWETSKGKIHLSVEFIDNLFYEYSEHGLNFSQTEIINKYNLQVWEWTSIKNTLWLFKKSNIFSPYTVEHTPKDELEQMIREKMDKLFKNIGYQVEQQYNKALLKKYKQTIKTETQKQLELQTMVAELSDLIPECKVEPIKLEYSAKNDKVLNVFLFDIHFGAENALDKKLPIYNVELTTAYLNKISQLVNQAKASEVHIFFGGDQIESFTGLNHMDSWKGVQKGYHGANLVIECYKSLVTFISQIANVTKIYAVPGNHDRASDRKEVDGEGFIARIIFELVSQAFKNEIDVIYDDRLVSQSIDGINYIMSHGHLKLTDINPAELILEYGVPGQYNILVSGHWHERRIKKDSKNFRQIVCPSLFPGNNYSVNLGYSTQPGFITVENNGDGKPIVIDYSL